MDFEKIFMNYEQPSAYIFFFELSDLNAAWALIPKSFFGGVYPSYIRNASFGDGRSKEIDSSYQIFQLEKKKT